MKVKNGLSGIATRVDYQAKAPIGNPLLARQSAGNLKDPSDHAAIDRLDVRYAATDAGGSDVSPPEAGEDRRVGRLGEDRCGHEAEQDGDRCEAHQREEAGSTEQLDRMQWRHRAYLPPRQESSRVA